MTLDWASIEGFKCPPFESPIYGLKIKLPYTFFMVEAGGRCFHARKVPDIEAMGTFIEERTFPLRLQAAIEAMQAGQTAHFGPARATPDGLRGFGIGTVKWEDLKGLGIGRMNRITAYERGVPVGQRGPFFVETPNARALFALVAAAREKQEG
jgi:hypothetical protein